MKITMNKKTLRAFNHIYTEHIRLTQDNVSLTQENQRLKEKLENTFDHSIQNFVKNINDGFSRIFEMPIFEKPKVQRKRDKKGRFTK
jgi:thiamine biosynthesis lipoprotein ApbE